MNDTMQSHYLPERAFATARAPGGLLTYRRAILVHALLDLLLYGEVGTTVGLACNDESIHYEKTGKHAVAAVLSLGTMETTTFILPQEHVHLTQFLEEQGFTVTATRAIPVPSHEVK